jgi:hypothetical protein
MEACPKEVGGPVPEQDGGPVPEEDGGPVPVVSVPDQLSLLIYSDYRPVMHLELYTLLAFLYFDSLDDTCAGVASYLLWDDYPVDPFF